MTEWISIAVGLVVLGALAFVWFSIHRTLQKQKDSQSRTREELQKVRQDLFQQLNEIIKVTLNELSDSRSAQQNNFDRLADQVRDNLHRMQQSNENKLEQMRATVDERLQKTLETRLGESFQLVSQRLEEVHKGLGEMQSLASGVGDLKKVLTNVKTRGLLGEYQLELILEQILTSDQYEKDVRTKKNSQSHVEFAIKLPGRNEDESMVWLPIDSKFPIQHYEELLNAVELGDSAAIEESKKALIRKLKTFARDISSKYLDPPQTTDFAILFLPIEGLYAEVLRHPEVFESLQRDYRITIAGPTTLSAILNSLQMGFRTLAIQKRSSEVWKVLAAVKQEFATFGEVLDKAQSRLHKTSEELDKLVGVRTRQIERRLSNIQAFSESGEKADGDQDVSLPILEN